MACFTRAGRSPAKTRVIAALRAGASILVAALFAAACTTLPGAGFPRAESTALADPALTRLGQKAAALATPYKGQSGFRIINAGVDAFVTRAQMIDAAERTLDLQYYIYRLDDTGRLLTEAILRAADRGVRVRLLLDDGDTVAGDEHIVALEAHPRIEVRIFNPFSVRGHSKVSRALEFIASARRVDYRMHNKLLVVDNAAALAGGRNVGDEYFQVDPQAQFGDDDVFAVGPVVRQLSASFDQYWNSALAIPGRALHTAATTADLDALRAALLDHKEEKKAERRDYLARLATGQPFATLSAGRDLVWANALLVADSPEKRKVVRGETPGASTHGPLYDAIAGTQSELLMVTPFFVPGADGLALFAQLRQRGAAIRALTNSLESNPEGLAHSGYRNYRRRMLEMGVELHEVRARLGDSRGSGQSEAMSRHGNYGLHAKLYVIDRRRVIIGSMNFDQRSAHINTEIGLMIDSPALAEQVAARFAAITRPENSYAVRLGKPEGPGVPRLTWVTRENGVWRELTEEPARSTWQRVKSQLMSVLPIEGEL